MRGRGGGRQESKCGLGEEINWTGRKNVNMLK